MVNQADSMMNTHAQARSKTASRYHHGGLREALILVAREALRIDPPRAIQLKDLAARLGVSQPAPYRHFQNRDALMAAVASDGFARLFVALTAAEQQSGAHTALQRICLAYLDFGAENLGVYRLMFSRKTLSVESGAGNSADASFAVLANHVAQRVGANRAAIMAISTWATLHGLVTLTGEDLLTGPQRQARSADSLAREIALSLLQG